MHDPIQAPGAAARAFAWGGAAAFVASLSFFLFSYDVTFVAALVGPASANAIAWNTSLFSIFALHHSLFARIGVRTWIQRALPTLERSAYVWVASVLFVLVCALWRPVPGVAWKIYGGPAVMLRLLHVVGIVLSVGSAAAIDIWELAGVKQIHQGPSPTDTEFKATGT